MSDAECIAFLQWALPRLRLSWPGFRKVHKQVCKRIVRRARALGLYQFAEYRAYLESHGMEWDTLATLCTVSISRFYRDRSVFDALAQHVLPTLAVDSGAGRVDAWSAGCASGEEAYSVLLLWRIRLQSHFPGLVLRVLGTDIDPALIDRARTGCYPPGSLAALPEDLRSAFEARAKSRCLQPSFRKGVEFARQDLRTELPQRLFDVILCRNLAFTYFAPALAREALTRLESRLRPGGVLVIGLHEHLPEDARDLAPWPGCRAIYRNSG
jgi:chemotaxis protein methyltransferase CheR